MTINTQEIDLVIAKAIERAIKAEAKFTECRKAAEVLQSEIERLTDLLDHYNAKCAICDYTTEITKLRKVAEAAREMLEVIELLHPNMNPDEPCVCYEAWVRGKQAFAELDKEGERKEG